MVAHLSRDEDSEDKIDCTGKHMILMILNIMNIYKLRYSVNFERIYHPNRFWTLNNYELNQYYCFIS